MALFIIFTLHQNRLQTFYLIISWWLSCLYYFTFMDHGDQGVCGKQAVVLSFWDHFFLSGSLGWSFPSEVAKAFSQSYCMELHQYIVGFS